MAIRSRQNTASSTRQTANTKLCSCMTCAHSMLHRYGDNPILAACGQKPQPGNVKFPYEVMVASAVWACPNYKQAEGEKWVQPRLTTRTA
jgi:hypothetical protein